MLSALNTELVVNTLQQNTDSDNDLQSDLNTAHWKERCSEQLACQ